MNKRNVYLAIGYDTEQVIPNDKLPEHIIKQADYQELTRQGRKDAWTNYLWKQI